MTNEPPTPERPGRRPRLTRRGRLVLLTSALVTAAAALLVPLLTPEPQQRHRPPPPAPKTLVVPEGRRATQVYAAVDKALGVAAGTTRRVAGTAKLNLPAAAGGDPEGYLFPATYPVVDGKTTPASLLGFMVDTANQRFGTERVTSGARRLGLTPHQAVNVASIVQAEADTADDMGKVARVIQNRLARGMPLQMDSTINYALGRSTLDTTTADTRLESPYNTYERQGLPPSPIANPGEEAMHAAVAPPPGDWLYFVTVRPGDTRFTGSYEEHQRNVAEFNAARAEDRAGGG
ncbi:endolytic transglycosylase MltG [Streptomyces peucetius]|uniref:Endolytic murein transglycosylase n=1 Tax=Streptomyces peucetius TaxID=1950 RepID=A0ABY6I4Y0_STRPE|nr:endolytic transglycosylase MltG [Streptomyces peucetius]UYQ60805.1 endolytic transglycosylase MltG [Streptomyces peucetius]